MKAYTAQNEEGYNEIVFAETANKAKTLLLGREYFEGYSYTDIRVCRAPSLDDCYRGNPFMEWDDPEDRLTLARMGWHCHPEIFDTAECEVCVAKDICDYYTDMLDEFGASNDDKDIEVWE